MGFPEIGSVVALISAVAAVMSALYGARQQKALSLKADSEAAEIQDRITKSILDRAEGSIKQLRDENVVLSERLEELQADLDSARASIKAIMEENARLHRRILELEEERLSWDNERRGLHTEIESLKKRLNSMEKGN